LFTRKVVLALTLVLALSLAAVVAGCGGGGSSSGSSTGGTSSDAGGEAPTKAVFIKEADKVCSEAENELVEEVKDFAKENGIPLEKEEPSEAQQAELFRSVILPNIGKQAEELAALTPPEGDEGTIEDLTDTLSSEVAEAEEEPGAPADDTLAGATKKAKAYGLKTCGS
jgi:ABC-type glycerol-3-phosphate transport system substrate-binding protein